MPLKIQETITREYDVMLYCKETGETKEATLQDLKGFGEEPQNYDLAKQLSDLEYENIELIKLTEKLSKENLELKEKVNTLTQQLSILQTNPYEHTPWDYYNKPFEVTCREQIDPYDFNPGITTTCGHCCDYIDTVYDDINKTYSNQEGTVCTWQENLEFNCNSMSFADK